MIASAQTSFDWLNDAVHPREVALASATVAAASSEEALGVNPASLRGANAPYSSDYGIHLALCSYPADIHQQLVQITFPAGLQRVGLEVRRFDYGTFKGYKEEREPQADYDAADLLVRGGVTRQVGEILSLGASLGALSSRLEEETARAILWAIGVQLEVVPLDARLGAVLQNRGKFTSSFGSTLPDELPSTWLVGMTKTLAYLPFTLYVTIGENIATEQFLWRLGGECQFPWQTALRLGVDQGKLDYSRGNVYADLFSGISLGFGTRTGGSVTRPGQESRKRHFTLDAAVKLLGPLGYTTAIAVGMLF